MSRLASNPTEPHPAPTSQRTWPGPRASLARTTARTSALVMSPAWWTRAASGSPRWSCGRAGLTSPGSGTTTTRFRGENSCSRASDQGHPGDPLRRLAQVFQHAEAGLGQAPGQQEPGNLPGGVGRVRVDQQRAGLCPGPRPMGSQVRPWRLMTVASCQGIRSRAQAVCTAVRLGWITTCSAPRTLTTSGPTP